MVAKILTFPAQTAERIKAGHDLSNEEAHVLMDQMEHTERQARALAKESDRHRADVVRLKCEMETFARELQVMSGNALEAIK